MIGKPPAALKCPACDTPLSQGQGIEGLCPSCLLELALDDTSLEAEVLFEPEEAPTLQYPGYTFEQGQIQGERYRVRSLLGRGGMGEVWRAYDLKLRQDVALKALRSELIEDTEALETLRQEVRTAREVISPNVCRVFDLQELDGQELVAMEHIDGTTLQEILRDRSPLDLDEAREIASQFLAGLEAIHGAGLVHRDIKPENVMVTRTGRVVVMDFGIAKGLGDSKGGLIAGTPAYMSPEQAKGEELDARSDVFSAGVVLAEMVAPGGMHSFEDRQQLWEAIHRETPEIAETPWSRVIERCVTPAREARFMSAVELARALEEVTLRAAGDETARPYPGLSAFRKEDAHFFFGRELEVEALWKKLRRPHLLALIGPSGAGKSSFLRAGLLPTLTDGWQAIITTPGSHPFGHLARALANELGEATGVTGLLQRIDEPDIAVELLSEWRKRSQNALLIVDQFEELFTQNPEETQERFTELMGRLPLEANLYVMLSMRDDFVMHCHRFEALQPIFSDLTALDPPLGSSLRRALVEPALRCGYRFEEESIVEEMLAEVEGERGALPMVAFTAARLWEERDRETGFLTRKAYEQIGGVGGALAQHAETTLKQIGEGRIPVARELFRNLVTAQATRVARDREELLSVFAEKAVTGTFLAVPADSVSSSTERVPVTAFSAAEVLSALIDARLLTSYKVPLDEEGSEPHYRIEIVHESLLANWPRLVRWQMQDAEGAKLRDELRNQARLWDEHNRSEDYLWTGTAFKEYELWRERYPGGLTTLEEEYARTMIARTERRRRQRRVARGAILFIAIAISILMFFLWRISVVAEERAVAEARRAEAAELLALAQLQLADDPTEALAYTTASLKLADTEQARVFAQQVLWEAPAALEFEAGGSLNRFPAFSPDGMRLALAGHSEEVKVWTAEGTDAPIVLPGHSSSPRGSNRARWASNQILVTGHETEAHRRVWSFPEGRLVRTVDLGGKDLSWGSGWDVKGGRLYASLMETDAETGHEIVHLRSWRLPDGEPEELGTVDWTALGAGDRTFDFDASAWIYTKANEIFYRSLPVREGVADRLVGRHDNDAQLPYRLFQPERLFSRDAVTGEWWLWDLSSADPELLRVVGGPHELKEGEDFWPHPSLLWAFDSFFPRDRIRLWDLEAWPQSRPITLRRSGSWHGAMAFFHPRGDRMVASTSAASRLTFWPLRRPWPRVVDGYSGFVQPLAFSPDGKWLATVWEDQDQVRLWPLPGSDVEEVRSLALPERMLWTRLLFDPLMRFLFLVGTQDRVYIVPLDGSPPRRLEGFSDDTYLSAAAVSPSGRRVATAYGGYQGPKTLRVWDLETGKLRLLDLPESTSSAKSRLARAVWSVAFAGESALYTAGDGGVRLWDLKSGAQELVFATKPDYGTILSLAADGRTALVRERSNLLGSEGGLLKLLDLATGQTQALPAYGQGSTSEDTSYGIDGSGTVVVSSDVEGVVRVGRVSGGEPHLLVGHEGPAEVAISPDGRWIASAGQDDTLRLWPVPDLDKPPLHTLPHDELIAKLRSLTNLRAVRDPKSSTGWSIELDPFPGWKEVPTW